MDNRVIVSNIQRFSLSDGDGIRTTVFLKGCSLRCPWCANPENINNYIEEYYDSERNLKGKFGYEISLNDLYEEIIKDKIYYENGGVTFSGGEPLLWIKEIEPLLIKLKKEKINICFETSLYIPDANLKLAIKYADFIITDLKILDEDLVRKVLKNDLNLYLKNSDYLFNNFDRNKIILRIPVSNEYVINDYDKYIKFIKKYKPSKVEIFKLHNLGEKKYKLLNKKVTKFEEVSDNKLNDFKNEIGKVCIVNILKF